MFYKRSVTSEVLGSLKTSPVVFINGARQTGKSTLIGHIIDDGYNANYVSMDDPAALASASSDPFSFPTSFHGRVAIDEIQRLPSLFLPIKIAVDNVKKNGQSLLTGSANVLTIPRVSESLAGRVVIHTLWPLSQGEIRGTKERFIDTLFKSKGEIRAKNKPLSWTDVVSMIMLGGYPRIVRMTRDKDKRNWFKSYIDTILARDVKDLANIEGLKELPNLLYILAERCGNILNMPDVSRMVKLKHTTLRRYYSLLQSVFLVVELPAWFTNREKRLVKTPKVYLNDTGLLCYLRGLDYETLHRERIIAGHILENFVVMELVKQVGWSEVQPRLYHFRTHAGNKVDIVMEGQGSKLVGIEVKCSSSVSNSDFSGLRELQNIAKDKFIMGIVLYNGEHVLSFGKNLLAVPLGALWEL